MIGYVFAKRFPSAVSKSEHFKILFNCFEVVSNTHAIKSCSGFCAASAFAFPDCLGRLLPTWKRPRTTYQGCCYRACDVRCFSCSDRLSSPVLCLQFWPVFLTQMWPQQLAHGPLFGILALSGALQFQLLYLTTTLIIQHLTSQMKESGVFL